MIIKNIWEERELFPLNKSIYSCGNCNSYNIEKDAYKVLGEKLDNYRKLFGSSMEYHLGSRGGGNPKYNFIFESIVCSSCNNESKVFFYARFEESYFPKTQNEFFLADVSDSNMEDNIDGVYNRHSCQEFLKKMLMRWHILKNITYVVFPYIGNTYQSATERLELLGDFLSPLNPYKTLWITRSETLSQIKRDIDTDLGEGAYDALKKEGKTHPVIESAFKKRDFHAKFYCGIGEGRVEVLTGSHNLHGGNSMENLSFRDYSLDRFIERYMMQIGVAPIKKPTKTNTDVWVFDREKNGQLESYLNNASDILTKYNG